MKFTVDFLGACQGISWQNGKAYLYGDREVGMIREFDLLRFYSGSETDVSESGLLISPRFPAEGVAWRNHHRCVAADGVMTKRPTVVQEKVRISIRTFHVE